MTVTFFPEPAGETARTLGYHLVCPAEPRADRREFVGYHQAVAGLADHDRYCRHPDCGPGEPFPVARRPEEPWLQVASAHAPVLLRALGFLPEIGVDDVLAAVEPATTAWCDLAQHGRCRGEDLLARIDLARALAPPDAGLPAHDVGPASRRDAVHDLGRPAGFLSDRLHRLREVAEFAVHTGRAVCWA